MLGHFGMIPLKTRIPVRENSEVVIICPEELSPSSKSEVLEEETSLAIHGKVGGEKLALLREIKAYDIRSYIRSYNGDISWDILPNRIEMSKVKVSPKGIHYQKIQWPIWSKRRAK